MRKSIVALCLCLAFAGTAIAGPNEAAAAYKSGDYAKAFRLWHEQAERGNYSAQGMLGFLYHDGDGVAKDLVRAHMWFEISRSLSPAREQSWQAASDALDLTAKKMTAQQIAEAKAMAERCQSQNYKNCD